MPVDTLTGSGTWTCPAGVTSVAVECTGKGGNAAAPDPNAAAGAGGGGAYSKLNSFAVTPGNVYNYNTNNSGGCWFNTAATVFAQSGQDGITGTGGAGGDAASGIGDTKHSGGLGGNGFFIVGQGGGGGGGEASGGAAAGNPGADGGNVSGGAGGTGTAGADGGNGGDENASGVNGSDHGGGGGGAGKAGATSGTGAGGKVVLTYTVTPGGGGGTAGGGFPATPPDIVSATPQEIVSGSTRTIIGGCGCCGGGGGDDGGVGCAECPMIPECILLKVPELTIAPAFACCREIKLIGAKLRQREGGTPGIPGPGGCNWYWRCIAWEDNTWRGYEADLRLGGSAKLAELTITYVDSGTGDLPSRTTYEAPLATWKCLGENTLARTGSPILTGCLFWPPTVTLVPVAC